MGFISSLIDLLFPPKCVFCGKLLAGSDSGFCEKCAETLPFTKNGGEQSGDFFDACVSPLYYRDNVRKSILRFKFRGAAGNADAYAIVLADCIRKNLAGKYDMISWVPLSKDREKTRGYDQAMLLALGVALRLDDVAVETLTKPINVPAQSSLTDKAERKANISGAYTVADEELIAGRKILLIDDIVTTGSTLSECARILLTAGAESVVCAALARGQ